MCTVTHPSTVGRTTASWLATEVVAELERKNAADSPAAISSQASRYPATCHGRGFLILQRYRGGW